MNNWFVKDPETRKHKKFYLPEYNAVYIAEHQPTFRWNISPPKRRSTFKGYIFYIPEDRTLHNHRCEDLKSYKRIIIWGLILKFLWMDWGKPQYNYQYTRYEPGPFQVQSRGAAHTASRFVDSLCFITNINILSCAHRFSKLPPPLEYFLHFSSIPACYMTRSPYMGLC
jgi:hypothetical protein